MIGRRFFSCPRATIPHLSTAANRSGRPPCRALITAVASSRLPSELTHLSTLSITCTASLTFTNPNSRSFTSHNPFNMSQRRVKSSKATNGSANGSTSRNDEHEHEHEDSHTHSHSIFSGHSHSHGDDGHGHGQEKIIEALQGGGEW